MVKPVSTTGVDVNEAGKVIGREVSRRPDDLCRLKCGVWRLNVAAPCTISLENLKLVC